MFIQQLFNDPRYFFAVVLTVVISIVFHELAHGLTAVRLGDHTPIEEDRLTLNPFVHMGVFSIIVMLLSGIAWGAMPIDRSRLRGKYGEAVVAAAGPLSNVVMALLALTALGLWLRFDHRPSEDLSNAAENARYLLLIFGVVNVHLALFNLIPFPPLDGSRILGNFSRSFDEAVNQRFMASPLAMMQLSVIMFSVAGTLSAPVALKAAFRYLQFVRG